MKKKITAEEYIDNRGILVPFEVFKEIPFEIKRFFFIKNIPVGGVRGNHANMEGESVIILISGRVKVSIENGKEKENYVLSDDFKSVYIPIATWIRIENLESDTIIFICSSNYYHKDAYITDYDMFKQKEWKNV